MKQSVKHILMISAGGVSVFLLLVMVNQLGQLYGTLQGIHPLLAGVVTLLAAVLMSGIFFLPVFGYISLKKPLTIPQEDDGEAWQRYLGLLKGRLEKNRCLREADFQWNREADDGEEVGRALQQLDARAEKEILEAASTVFLTTAISQNGVLDGVFVLTSLSRLVWRISHLYNQRPGLREIIWLYGNVAATVLMAREIEDLALLDEQLEPVISSLIGGTLGSLVPGTTAVVNLMVNSVIEGSVNAFLTLRVGVMARRYSQPLTRPDRRQVRRLAVLEACGLLGGVVRRNSVEVVRAFAAASKRATVDRTVDTIRDGAQKTGTLMKNLFRKPRDGAR